MAVMYKNPSKGPFLGPLYTPDDEKSLGGDKVDNGVGTSKAAGDPLKLIHAKGASKSKNTGKA